MMDTQHVDVLIVGAGVSGIGMACHLRPDCPDKSFAILERRHAMGGTWDLFRYPGIRSDSDMLTFGLQLPAVERHEGRSPTARRSARTSKTRRAEYRVTEHTRFGRSVVRAEWSTPDQRWTVETRSTTTPARRETYTANFIVAAHRLLRLRRPATGRTSPVSSASAGTVVHPQHWPEDLDCRGKRVVVIGSGATAVTLVPAMADDGRARDDAAALPDLHRVAAARVDKSRHAAQGAARQAVYRLARARNIAVQRGLYAARTVPARPRAQASCSPTRARQLGRHVDMRQLQAEVQPVGPAAVRGPRRRPVPGVRERHGRRSSPTTIDTFTETGILLESGAATGRRHHRHGNGAGGADPRRHRDRRRRRAGPLARDGHLQGRAARGRAQRRARSSATPTRRGRSRPTSPPSTSAG